MAIIDEVVNKIEDWKGKNVSIQPLSGGLTNTNFKVEVDGISYFVRVPGKARNYLQLTEITNIITPGLQQRRVSAQRYCIIFLNTM